MLWKQSTQVFLLRPSSVRLKYRLGLFSPGPTHGPYHHAHHDPIHHTHPAAKSDPTQPSPTRSNICTRNAVIKRKKKRKKNLQISPSAAQPSAAPASPDRSKLRLPLTEA